MFLHLIGNDPKFPEIIRKKFELIDPGEHTYVIIKSGSAQPKHAGEGFIYVETPEAMSSLVCSRSDWEGVILNGLLSRIAPYLSSLPVGVPLCYYIWGSEAYGAVQRRPNELYAKYTSKVMSRRVESLRFLLSTLCGPQASVRKDTRAVTRKIDFVISSFEEEVDYFKHRGLLPQGAQFVQGNVGLRSDAEHQVHQGTARKKNLLVGNSAAPTNNHLDLFKWLSSGGTSLKGREIIVPLSYGGDQRYRDLVIEEGYKIFGEAFRPLLEFMPRDEYLQILQSCELVVMGHLRQQGVGNILSALGMGVGVSLPASTTLYRGLLNFGFNLRANDFDAVSLASSLVPLEESAAQENLELMCRHFSREQSLSNARELLKLMREHTQDEN